MSGDLRQFLQQHRAEILKEAQRLDKLKKILNDEENKENLLLNGDNDEHSTRPVNKTKDDFESVEDRVAVGDSGDQQDRTLLTIQNRVTPIVEPLDLRECYDFDLARKKQALIDRLSSSEEPFTHRSADEAGRFGVSGYGAPYGLPSLRRGEYAPSTSYGSVRAAPHVGLGEYEVGRSLRNRLRYSQSAKSPQKTRDTPQTQNSLTSRGTNTELSSVDSKSVQTDIQNINCELVVKHDLGSTSQEGVSTSRTVTDDFVDAALRKRAVSAYPLRFDQRLTTEQNEALLRATGDVASMDKPKGILTNRRTGSPRDRYAGDLGTHSAFLDGFSYSNRSDELDRERLKRETYQHELRLQIDEKRRLATLRDEQERHERELENRRLEQQLMRMREEQAQEDQRRQSRNELMRRHSDDMLRRKTELHEMQRPWRRHADSESANLDSIGLTGAANYSPPVTRRALAPVSPYSPSTSYNVPPTSVFPESGSFNRYNSARFESSSYPGGILRNRLSAYDTVPLPRSHHRSSNFDRFDSLSRIDSLSHRLETLSVRDGYTSDLTDVQRRHSATQQDLSRSPRLRRRNSSSRFEDQLPAPVLKARSPVAKELRNAVPFSSHRSTTSDHQRWQKSGLMHPALESPIGSRGGILTQLGSIRAQLQREQLRMDESLRRRGLTRTRTTEDY